jgi:hypothetical protein
MLLLLDSEMISTAKLRRADMRGLVAIAASIAFAGTANAQDYPDLKGTWAGTVEVVSAQLDPASVLGEDATAVDFSEVPVEVVIQRQKGRRFVGTVSGKSWSKHFVGAFDTADTIVWAEPNGHVSGRLLGSDTLDYCYLESKDFRQMTACAHLTRKP